MQRHSKQRDEILKNLRGRTDHPTAEMVYESVRNEMPHISLGTVYRNLRELAREHRILCFQQDGKEHFDGNSKPHIHICCTRCGGIWDKFMDDMSFAFCEKDNFYIENLIVQGVCEACSIKEETETTA